MIPLGSHRCPSFPYHLQMKSNIQRSYFLPFKPVEVFPPLVRGVRRPLSCQKRDAELTPEGPNGEILSILKRCWLYFVSRVSPRAFELVHASGKKSQRYEDDLEVLSEYDVFLSFRGPDSRQCLTDVLYRDMTVGGICAFRDNDELQIGDKISKILPCINNSKICVVIFSGRFAESDWCLREVERMVDLKKTIMPIYYKVTPDDVKLRTDLFKKDLQKHVKKHGKDQVKKWEDALKAVGKIIGQEVKSTGLAEFSKSFVTELIVKFKVNRQDVPEFLVQRDDQEEALMKLIDGNEARLVIGIHGMGGVGKTTLAKVVFNRLSAGFDCSSFLENIQESVRAKGLECLLKQLLEDLDPKLKDFPVTDPIRMLKEKFSKRKVLIILDDVNEREHVDMIVGALDQFGPRSRIIITTRDRRVFTEGARAFELQEMNRDQALQLFSRHAFRKDSPPKHRKNLSDEVVHLTGKLPLALGIIGSRLRPYDDEKIWKETIEKLKDTLDQGVLAILRISFDALDSQEKQIFLDITCFFVDKEMSRAKYMWEDCRLFPVLGIEVLVSMSLLKITAKDEFWMHDLVRDLGRAIVREKYPDEPVKWSRIWSQTEAVEVLKIKKGKEEVKGIYLQKPPTLEEFAKLRAMLRGKPLDEPYYDVNLTNEELSSFSSLRFLELENTSLIGDFKHILLPQLRWFSWHNCPYDFSPTNLYLEKLVILELSGSDVSEDWPGWSLIQRANNLKVLDLTRCFRLTRTPDLSNNQALEILLLRGCSDLVEIHSSIGKLKRLKHLDLAFCRKMHVGAGILQSIGKLVNLTLLDLRGCIGIKVLPGTIGDLQLLVKLDLSNTELSALPNTVGRLAKLQSLYLRNAKITELPCTVGELKSLCRLDLSQTKVSMLPESIGQLDKLENLSLDDTMIKELPNTFGYLASLKELSMRRTHLKELPDSFGALKSLEVLNVEGSPLTVLPERMGDLTSLKELSMCQTHLKELPDSFGALKSLEVLNVERSPLTVLPERMGDLASLKELSMCRTHLKELPDSFGALKLLEVLNLEGSPLTVLPKRMGDLASLKELSMCRTHLKELPDSFGDLKSLEVLNLEGSPLTVLPERVGDLKSLRHLNLAETKVSVLPNSTGQLDKLQWLSLKSTMVEELPDSLGDLSNLEELFMDSCKNISKLPRTIGKLTKLRKLYALGCNSLTEIPPEIGNLSNLTCLKLTASPVAKVPPTINHLTSLKQLSIGFHLDDVHGSGPAILTTSLDLGALTLLADLELDCLGFKCIAQLPPELWTLTLSRVAPETKLPDFSNLKTLRRIEFRDCSLRDVHELESLREVRSLWHVAIYNCPSELVQFCRQLRGVEGTSELSLMVDGDYEPIPMAREASS